MFCPKCGKQIDDDSVFCEYCGENVEETPAADPFQTVYADDNAYDNNDYNNYTDNYADNYADNYNNAYPTNFTEPEPIPNPAPEKSGKKMIAAVCAVCSVMLVLMAVLCAKFIFGGKKIQTDDQSANSLAAAVTTTAADSSSMVAEESSAAETAVTTAETTAATTAPAAESSSSKAEKEKKKKQLSGMELRNMTFGQIRDYVGDDYEIGSAYVESGGWSFTYFGITSKKYFPGIVCTGDEYSPRKDDDTIKRDVVNNFVSGNNADMYPEVEVVDGGLVAYGLDGSEIRIGDKYNNLMQRIDSLRGITCAGDSESIIDKTNVDLRFDYYDDSSSYDPIFNPYDENPSLVSAVIKDPVSTEYATEATVIKQGTQIVNAPYDYKANSSGNKSACLVNMTIGDKLYINPYSYDGWCEVVMYECEINHIVQYKNGYVRESNISYVADDY